MGAKQFVGTIEEVETHDQNPTTNGERHPWSTFHDEFGDFGERLKETYRNVASEDGPSEEEIREAFGTLIGAWDQVAGSVSTALQDPEVRARLKAAASSFANAVGNTISELGDELLESDGRDTSGSEDPDGSAEGD